MGKTEFNQLEPADAASDRLIVKLPRGLSTAGTQLPTGKSVPQSLLLRRLEFSFSTVYLTLTSIIQGATFSYLAAVVLGNYRSYGLTEWILTATTFAVIVIAWNEYMMGAITLVWIPSLTDSLIPFLMGGAQMLMVRSIGPDPAQWYLWAAIFSLVALGAFVNMYYNAGKAEYAAHNT